MVKFVLCLLGLVALFASSGCQSSPALSVVQVTPSSAALTTTEETVQFRATGTFVHNTHPAQTPDLTNQVTWASSNPAVATISSAGLATAAALVAQPSLPR